MENGRRQIMKKSGSALKECAVKHALSHTPALRKNSSGKRDTDKGSRGWEEIHLFRVFRTTGSHVNRKGTEISLVTVLGRLTCQKHFFFLSSLFLSLCELLIVLELISSWKLFANSPPHLFASFSYERFVNSAIHDFSARNENHSTRYSIIRIIRGKKKFFFNFMLDVSRANKQRNSRPKRK